MYWVLWCIPLWGWLIQLSPNFCEQCPCSEVPLTKTCGYVSYSLCPEAAQSQWITNWYKGKKGFPLASGQDNHTTLCAPRLLPITPGGSGQGWMSLDTTFLLSSFPFLIFSLSLTDSFFQKSTPSLSHKFLSRSLLLRSLNQVNQRAQDGTRSERGMFLLLQIKHGLQLS